MAGHSNPIPDVFYGIDSFTQIALCSSKDYSRSFKSTGMTRDIALSALREIGSIGFSEFPLDRSQFLKAGLWPLDVPYHVWSGFMKEFRDDPSALLGIIFVYLTVTTLHKQTDEHAQNSDQSNRQSNLIINQFLERALKRTEVKSLPYYTNIKAAIQHNSIYKGSRHQAA
ncbi:hypothetical protein [Microvirga soli]|uniref:hypothetical protein n=1 Tax=Microvirga soli TaxID=1854496 RepID=UPI00191C9EFA|nr:hypothetical protein [Microvirga soli]